MEDDGEPRTINLCMNCYSSRQEESMEPAVSCRQWKIIVSDKSSRGKLSACLRARGFEQKMRECSAANEMFANSSMESAATALKLGKRWTEESPYKEELALLRESGSLHLSGIVVRRAMKAATEDGCSELLRNCHLNHHEVKQDEDQRCRRARISEGGSSCQSNSREGSHFRMYAHTAIDF